MIAGFWDEIEPTASAGGIYFQEYADRAVVQYDQVPRISEPAAIPFRSSCTRTA